VSRIPLYHGCRCRLWCSAH